MSLDAHVMHDSLSSMSETNDLSAKRPRLRELSVPEDLYEEVIDFIADRRRAQRLQGEPGTTGPGAADDAGAPGAGDYDEEIEGPPWDPTSLAELLNQANPKLVRALVALARSRDHQLSTEKLIAAANEGQEDPETWLQAGRAWGGFLSRSQTSSRRRFGRKLPMRWVRFSSQNYYRMSPHEATSVREWADQRRQA
jgi:hypothetical protein